MTIDELIQAFPECEKIKREDIAECITKAMTEEKFYSNALTKIYQKAHALYPPYMGPYEEGLAYRNAYHAYFYTDIYTWKRGPFGEWIDTLRQAFIALHGQVHTFDEACQIAADEWARMIFGDHIQDNGDESETGYFGMMLGTKLKNSISRRYTSNHAKRFRRLMKEYYLADCIPERFNDRPIKFAVLPSCDYHPNEVLFNILVKSGINEQDANNICPWKTSIYVDELDNSVCVKGYRTERLF